jgi:hypothetical protein
LEALISSTDVVHGDAQALEDVSPLLGLVQIEPGAPQNHLAPVLEEILQNLLHVEEHRPVADHGHHVHAERGLELGILVQGVDDDVGDRTLLHVQDDADALAVGLVAQVGHVVDLVLVDQLGDLLHQGRLVHRKRNLADDDGLAVAFALLDLRRAPDAHRAPAGLIGLDEPPAAVAGGAGGKVRTLDEGPQVGHRALGIVKDMQGAVDQLAQVVGRDVRGHAHGDAARAVQ